MPALIIETESHINSALIIETESHINSALIIGTESHINSALIIGTESHINSVNSSLVAQLKTVWLGDKSLSKEKKDTPINNVHALILQIEE